jgi:hypothetical protein
MKTKDVLIHFTDRIDEEDVMILDSCCAKAPLPPDMKNDLEAPRFAASIGPTQPGIANLQPHENEDEKERIATGKTLYETS